MTLLTYDLNKLSNHNIDTQIYLKYHANPVDSVDYFVDADIHILA